MALDSWSIRPSFRVANVHHDVDTAIRARKSTIPVDRKTPGGDEILKEVSSFLDRKLAEALPEPPATVETSGTEKAALEGIVALTGNCSQAMGRETVEQSNRDSSQTLFSYKKAEIQEISLTVEKPTLEDVLLEYVEKSNGEIDIKRCSADLEASYEEIVKALESLGAKGRIKVELKSGG
jgi:biopolymer transport protein ExbD